MGASNDAPVRPSVKLRVSDMDAPWESMPRSVDRRRPLDIGEATYPESTSLDLPVAAAKHRYALAVRGDAVHVELRRADHEVDVLAALVHARDVLRVDEEREAASERDVAGGVLVEER